MMKPKHLERRKGNTMDERDEERRRKKEKSSLRQAKLGDFKRLPLGDKIELLLDIREEFRDSDGRLYLQIRGRIYNQFATSVREKKAEATA
ncbi:hypothetical protein PoB_001601400 [Plakobranchus ocellatus]|uniref:Uncharacterized protein n=1 Tax=Plakobranchus ocellatus TaxID=259542 RepID=A0AAV3Z561_9GAST|nr:hypothetical protein PoB_001601400 [Plakobranchus ocellatus]